MKKFIHIHAKCTAFEIFEQVEESKAVPRLIKIRNNFKHLLERRGSAFAGNLVVKTCLVNPEVMFAK